MTYEDNCLAHFGIRGQKWGVRRYQNEDGTLTEEGKQRYYKLFSDDKNNAQKDVDRLEYIVKDLRKNGWKATSVFDDDELGDAIAKEYGKKQAKKILNQQILDFETSLAMRNHQVRYSREMSDFISKNKNISLAKIMKESERITRQMGKDEGIDDETVSVVAKGRAEGERDRWKSMFK